MCFETFVIIYVYLLSLYLDPVGVAGWCRLVSQVHLCQTSVACSQGHHHPHPLHVGSIGDWYSAWSLFFVAAWFGVVHLAWKNYKNTPKQVGDFVCGRYNLKFYLCIEKYMLEKLHSFNKFNLLLENAHFCWVQRHKNLV